MPRTRRRFSADEKAQIVKRHLIGREPISDLCDELNLQPSQVYRWQEQLFQNASAAFDRTSGGKPTGASRDAKKLAALEEKLSRKNEVVAEIMEAHVTLKKTLGQI